MKFKYLAAAVLAVGLAAGAPVVAKEKARTYVVMNDEMGVPVFPYDFPDRPYDVVGEVDRVKVEKVPRD